MKKIIFVLILLCSIFSCTSCDILLSSGKQQQPQYVLPTGISLSQNIITGYKGDKFLLSATITPSNSIDQSVYWSTDNPNVATVSTIGLVELKNVGDAIITATTAYGQTAHCLVSVERNIEHVVINITMENAGKYFDFHCYKENGLLRFVLVPKKEYDSSKYVYENVCYTITGSIFYRDYYGSEYGDKDFTFPLYLDRSEIVRIPAGYSIVTYSYKITNVSGTMSYYVEH